MQCESNAGFIRAPLTGNELKSTFPTISWAVFLSWDTRATELFLGKVRSFICLARAKRWWCQWTVLICGDVLTLDLFSVRCIYPETYVMYSQCLLCALKLYLYNCLRPHVPCEAWKPTRNVHHMNFCEVREEGNLQALRFMYDYVQHVLWSEFRCIDHDRGLFRTHCAGDLVEFRLWWMRNKERMGGTRTRLLQSRAPSLVERSQR